jgi:hypothetical protein
MPDLVGLKVEVYRKPDGYLDYPQFKSTLQVCLDNPDTAVPDIRCDRTSDCRNSAAHSPLGVMLGIMLVDKTFARQALDAFPTRVFEMTELEIKDFWENRITVRIPANRVDTEVLVGLQAEKALRVEALMDTTEVDAAIAKALDPDDFSLGVRKNKMKLWDDVKADEGIKVVSAPPGL